MSGHVALFFEVDTNPDALEGFFLTHSTLAGIEEKSDGTRAFYLPGRNGRRSCEKRSPNLPERMPA